MYECGGLECVIAPLARHELAGAGAKFVIDPREQFFNGDDLAFPDRL